MRYLQTTRKFVIIQFTGALEVYPRKIINRKRTFISENKRIPKWIIETRLFSTKCFLKPMDIDSKQTLKIK